MGAIGYFSTYTLGNLLAAQLAETLAQETGGQGGALARGDWQGVLTWMREKIQKRGSLLDPPTLIAEATGQALSPAPFLRHLRTRYCGAK
jgi:carboxypeptidase Taq